MYDALIRLIRESSVPQAPLPPPALPPEWEALVYPEHVKDPVTGIRAVLFDIYGTLFTSAAGDINALDGPSGEPPGETELPESLDALALEIGGAYTGEELKAMFRSEVRRIHGELYSKTSYPEIRVEELWKPFIEQQAQRRILNIGPEEFALRFELLVNPVYPMPGASDTLRFLGHSGLVLGIISNAQFFTPLLFDALFGESPEALGFDPELQIYSFEAGESKPSPVLFSKAQKRLSALSIAPEETLYIGNDLLNDIYPAASAGFKTLLFAGDGRSLRLREDNPLVRDTKARGVIRRLTDLPGFLGLRKR
jgi:putative hydrolase of the HAD superfamily